LDRQKCPNEFFRFGDTYQVAQEEQEEWRLHKFHINDTESVVYQLGHLFHCDIFSLANVTGLSLNLTQQAISILRSYANPKSTIVMWGTCDGCPDHEHSDQAIATKTLWQTLIENKVRLSFF
jgi:hypothetical protein